MADKSSIEWTDATWNPVTGCTKISPGCKNCYAERFAERWRGIAGHPYERGFDVTLHLDRLGMPLRWRHPRRIFVNSMSDLFHEDVPDWFIDRVMTTMRGANQHVYQVLTKRPQRMRAYMARSLAKAVLAPPEHIWFGVSVEDQARAEERIPPLLQTPAAVRWISAEPLLGPLSLERWLPAVPGRNEESSVRPRLAWVVVGGESGPGARPMQKEWVLAIRDQCRGARTSFFFKQWGGVFKKHAGRRLDGETYDELPLIRAAAV